VDPLRAEELDRLLPAQRSLAREIRILPVCASTQDEARAAGASHGLLVTAEQQDAGQGRRARDWWSGPPACNLAVTLVAAPAPDPPHLLGVAGAAALALTLQDWGCRQVSIKWPNDILIGGAKVAGVLGALLTIPPDTALLGLGVNVHAAPPPELLAYPATCVADALAASGRPAPDRTRLLAAWLWRLEAVLAQARANGPAALEDQALALLRVWAPRGVREIGSDAPAGGPLLEFRFGTGLAYASGDTVLRRPLAALGSLAALS
jgi:BirA family biotin operon repressor/biotin-[acetyl-CoA-carboxylase] ligase